MTHAPRNIVKFLDHGFTLLAWVSGLLAAVVMFATFANVVMRYVFRDPIGGVFEITEVGMGLIVFFALPKMIRMRGNIRVTIVFDRFSQMARRYTTFATELLGAAICSFIAWRMWLYGERILLYREVTMELRIPKGLIAQSMSLLLVAAAIAFVVCALEALDRSRGGGAEDSPA